MLRLVVLVSSNQSAATGLLPLDQGATSETNSLPMLPGEPISTLLVSPRAWKAPFTPTALIVVTLALVRPAALLKVGKGPAGEAPKVMLA